MIIGDDPKYLMRNYQGVLTLNIRKPGTFDGGKYSCMAVNELGQDEVECQLDVRSKNRGGWWVGVQMIQMIITWLVLIMHYTLKARADCV